MYYLMSYIFLSKLWLKKMKKKSQFYTRYTTYDLNVHF